MFLYQNPIYIQSLEKKFTNKTLYAKYFIRHSFNDQLLTNSLAIVDNYSLFYAVNLHLKYFSKTFFSKKVFKMGFSLSLENFIYENSFTQSKFKFYLLSSKSSVNYLDQLFIKLRGIQSKKKVLILVSPKRGGIRCYFNGICSFFPRKHLFSFYHKTNNLNSFLNLDKIVIPKLKSSRKLFSVIKRLIILSLKFKKNWQNSIFEINSLKLQQIKISFFNYLKAQIVNRKISHTFLLNLILLYYNRLKKHLRIKTRIQFFHKLNLFLNKDDFFPSKLNFFVYYNLSFKSKKRYFNGVIQRKTKKWRRRFFKAQIRMVILTYIRRRQSRKLSFKGFR